jgi:hypothetical protein
LSAGALAKPLDRFAITRSQRAAAVAGGGPILLNDTSSTGTNRHAIDAPPRSLPMMCLAFAIGSLGLGAMRVAYRRAASRQAGKDAGPFDYLASAPGNLTFTGWCGDRR